MAYVSEVLNKGENGLTLGFTIFTRKEFFICMGTIVMRLSSYCRVIYIGAGVEVSIGRNSRNTHEGLYNLDTH